MIKSSYKTRQQDLLLSFLKQTAGTHFTAEDVRRHFEKRETPLGSATIYRQLEKLVSDGRLVKYFIDEKSAACFEYTGEDSAKESAHFHIKCEKCGTLIHLDCEELDKLTTHLKSEHGITLNPLRTVFYGVCKSCAENENAKSKAGEK